ncbi:MAG: hypothetical protein KKA65_01775 [Nanoarchaeota archaeon]|nr:hypothetical protein [Nanoarchaeota archaeon]MBU4242036.1 hypothetical protein [Nanoarchaeota archaeon]MBU4351567.1 hypothetical protein [Nanoarchaeota archaeon]MBU4456206.1 hypothetical protein [Nanoarchaeota archaeon]MCG2719627.1 hypothetical protein [Nanoarchaeota archaeon]
MKWPKLQEFLSLGLSNLLKLLNMGLKDKDLEDIPVKKPLLRCGNPYCQEPIFEGIILYNPLTKKVYHTGQCEMYEELYFLGTGEKKDISKIHHLSVCPLNIMHTTNQPLSNVYFTPSKYLPFEEAQELYKKGKLNSEKLEEKVNN